MSNSTPIVRFSSAYTMNYIKQAVTDTVEMFFKDIFNSAFEICSSSFSNSLDFFGFMLHSDIFKGNYEMFQSKRMSWKKIQGLSL